MSNECKDWIIENNKQLCSKFPFLKLDDEYNYTWLDSLDSGWRTAFGDKMCEELLDILKKSNYVDKYKITQIKEKYGSLRWYDCGVPSDIFNEYLEWLNKYENLSSKTCICCGNYAQVVTRGWIQPYCKECIKKLGIVEKVIPIERWVK